MDNWGDPWADNADSAKSPTKTEVTSPLPPPFAPAPALLNGFLDDDAGWGNEDEGFGDWSTAPQPAEHVGPAKTSMTESYTPQTFEHTSNDIQWGSNVASPKNGIQDDGNWSAVERTASHDGEKVASETPTSSTTVRDELAGEPRIDGAVDVRADDDSSARASTSLSETSHNDLPSESPRTSFEEERGAAKGQDEVGIDRGARTGFGLAAPRAEAASPVSSKEEEEEHDGDRHGIADHATEVSETVTITDRDASALPFGGVVRSSRSAGACNIDSELLSELFAPSHHDQDLDVAPDDPIYSTSARKAWYRLTRKQTMREFNTGNDDDNYVRVTWANSTVRSEVNKIVGRWAREDRISGTGPGARASFYWDTPAPADLRPKTMQSARHVSQPVSSAIAPSRNSMPPLATNGPAAFDWSSPSVAVDPWQQSSSGNGSVSSPIAPISSSVAQSQAQQARVLLEPAPSKTIPSPGMQTGTANGETPAVGSLISPPPISDNIASSSDPWAGFNAFDSTPAVTTEPLNVSIDDDDEWGEMVSTATVSNPTTTIIEPPDKDSKSLAMPSTPPQAIKTASYQNESPDMMHAAPIVRLKTTISPTSALFKANSFIPLSAEQGPIGPGILKSSKRVASVTATATTAIEQSPAVDKPTPIVVSEPPPPSTTLDGLSDRQTSLTDAAIEKRPVKAASPTLLHPSSQEPSQPSTLPSAVAPAQSNVDAWADADFSFFEAEAPAPAVTPSKVKRDPSDPFSVFESPARSTSSASSAKPFTRSPPRKVTLPPVQPLTGATSAAQRRKEEEDHVIRNILSGLPDLSYMLRR